MCFEQPSHISVELLFSFQSNFVVRAKQKVQDLGTSTAEFAPVPMVPSICVGSHCLSNLGPSRTAFPRFSCFVVFSFQRNPVVELRLHLPNVTSHLGLDSSTFTWFGYVHYSNHSVICPRTVNV